MTVLLERKKKKKTTTTNNNNNKNPTQLKQKTFPTGSELDSLQGCLCSCSGKLLWMGGRARAPKVSLSTRVWPISHGSTGSR